MTIEPTLPTKKRDWQRLIDDLGLRPSKGRGQNFLFEQGVVHRIVKAAGISAADHVVEIGPGLGILTQELLVRAGRVTAIEIDAALAHHVCATFAAHDRFEVIEADALKVDFASGFGSLPVKVVANLPYSAASAIVMRLLESAWNMTSATVMVQLEVGDRMIATPPNMSILSVAVQVYAKGRAEFEVPPDVFVPSPAVDSLVMTLEPHAVELLAREDRVLFFRILNSGFRHKRKNLANSLADETRIVKSELATFLTDVGIDPMRRAQTLTVSEWLTLSSQWRWRDDFARS